MTSANTTLLFCGDTFLATRDGRGPFAHMCDIFSDTTVCLNLETSLASGKQKAKNVCLSVGEDDLDDLPEAVRIISLVNNHIDDSGSPAALTQALKARSKIVVGPGNPAVASTEMGGMTVDFLSAYFRLPRCRTSYNGPVANSLMRMLADSRADRRILNMHWGYEHTSVPAPFQRDLARRLVDAGADIIIGHHPHAPQGMETFAGKPVYYSLGNFNFWQFDRETSENNRWGYVVRYEIESGRAEPIPYRINENYQPHPVSREEREELAARLRQLSEAATAIDETTWFRTEYAAWYAHESRVWRRRCLKRLSPALWAKWGAWLCMPMQWKYRLSGKP